MFIENSTLSSRKAKANTGTIFGIMQIIGKEDLYLKWLKFHDFNQILVAYYQKKVAFFYFFTSLAKNAQSLLL